MDEILVTTVLKLSRLEIVVWEDHTAKICSAESKTSIHLILPTLEVLKMIFTNKNSCIDVFP